MKIYSVEAKINNGIAETSLLSGGIMWDHLCH